MDSASEKITDRQRARLNQLILSSVFSAEEARRKDPARDRSRDSLEMRLYHFRLKIKVTSSWRSSQLFCRWTVLDHTSTQ